MCEVTGKSDHVTCDVIQKGNRFKHMDVTDQCFINDAHLHTLSEDNLFRVAQEHSAFSFQLESCVSYTSC